MAEMKTFAIKVNQDEGLCKSVFLPCVRVSVWGSDEKQDYKFKDC